MEQISYILCKLNSNSYLQIRTDYTEKLLLLMDKSKAAIKIHKHLLNTISLAKGFCPWFHMGCLNMHGLCQFTILKMHIYMLRTQVFRLLCRVAWLLILNIPSEQRESLTLLFGVKTHKTKSSTSMPQESQITHNICFQGMLPH